MNNLQFIEAVAPLAQQGWKKYKILPSVTIAQAILESGWGKSGLTQKANALFGIKATPSWKGKVYSCKTQECYDGVTYTTITDTFRAYDSWAESVEDHGAFLAGLSRYSNLIGVTDPKTVCDRLQADGYATAPTYSSSLQKLIKTHNLTQYDPAAASKWEKTPAGWTYGDKKSQWFKDKGIWYYFDEKGIAVTGWHKLKHSKGTDWFYFLTYADAVKTGGKECSCYSLDKS